MTAVAEQGSTARSDQEKVKKDSGIYTYEVALGTAPLADPDLQIVF